MDPAQKTERWSEREVLVIHTLLLISAGENCPSSLNESAGRGVRGQNLISQEEKTQGLKTRKPEKARASLRIQYSLFFCPQKV